MLRESIVCSGSATVTTVRNSADGLTHDGDEVTSNAMSRSLPSALELSPDRRARRAPGRRGRPAWLAGRRDDRSPVGAEEQGVAGCWATASLKLRYTTVSSFRVRVIASSVDAAEVAPL